MAVDVMGNKEFEASCSFEASVMKDSDFRALFEKLSLPPLTMATRYRWRQFDPDTSPIVSVGGGRSCSVDAHGFDLVATGFIQLASTYYHEDGTVSVDMDFAELTPEPTVDP